MQRPLGRFAEALEKFARNVLDMHDSEPGPHASTHAPNTLDDPLATAAPSNDVDGDAPLAGSLGTLLRSDAKMRLGITTTKGDLIVRSTKNDRLAVGVNGEVLTADSTQASGVKWAAVAAGDLDAQLMAIML
jgi:hypothetical protein